ncbi:SAM-dependent methyltransferase [Leptolyngbya sp. AN03gr2]|uniref:SAM-dependent methyltransferase n=1 Tax=unclassified Leptolyngbya TaxID=2650499 RepID=UPI003D31E973
MISSSQKTKVAYGDFQTPLGLAEKVCQRLIKLDVCPDIVVEPTCGVGNFINAASSSFCSASRIIGIEINQQYIHQIQENKQLLQDQRIDLQQADFFRFDWSSWINQLKGNILVLGNFPWVTNAQQGSIGGENLPLKSNFQNHNGLDAITGKSNFDISEWMLIQTILWLQGRDSTLAMLCKTSVSRKILSYLHSRQLSLADCATYKIDAKKHFDADVEACLLYCRFDSTSRNYYCNVFDSLESTTYYRIGYRNHRLVRDIDAFEKLRRFYAPESGTKWRSGIKHDCSKVMEFREFGDTFVNGLGEAIDLEDAYLFPLLKGSDIAQDRIATTDKSVLVTQKFVGESTEPIRSLAPKTWKYLESHSEQLASRKSKIYHNHPKFSIFGVGAYTFAPWKIAICGLYKKLEFKLIGSIQNKPVVFDDTVYFLSFEDKETALRTLEILTSSPVLDFYSSLIFWDEKRPIKSSILSSLNLTTLLESVK